MHQLQIDAFIALMVAVGGTMLTVSASIFMAINAIIHFACRNKPGLS